MLNKKKTNNKNAKSCIERNEIKFKMKTNKNENIEN